MVATEPLDGEPPAPPAKNPLARAFFFIAAFAVSAATFLVRPAGDDWTTMTPLVPWDWASLRPGLFWRPFEAALRGLLGACPSAFPALPHALALLGQLLASLCLLRLLRLARVSDRLAYGLAGLTWLWPANAAAILSVDTAGQTLSTGFGLLATLALCSHRPFVRHLWLMCCALGVFWKESGIAWLVAAPVLAGYLTHPQENPSKLVKRAAPQFAEAAILSALYFGARFVLASNATLGSAEGRYSITLNPLILAKNFAMQAAVALIPLDTVSLFSDPRRLSLAFLPAIIAAPGLAILAWKTRKSYSVSEIFVFSAAFLALASPHMILSHTSELYAHSLSFILFLSLGVGATRATTLAAAASVRGNIFFGFWLFAIAGVFAFGLKSQHMIENGNRATQIARDFRACHVNQPTEVCAVVTSTRRGYSVFDMGPAAASGHGKFTTSEWNWKPSTARVVDDIAECAKGSAAIVFSADSWIISGCSPRN